MNKNINDGTHFQCSGTHKNLGLWIPGTDKEVKLWFKKIYPDGKVHGDSIGPIWGWQDPGGPHVGPMKFAIFVSMIFLSHAVILVAMKHYAE